jgi:hypothetical protein
MTQKMRSARSAVDCTERLNPAATPPPQTRRTTKLRSEFIGYLMAGVCFLPSLTGCTSSDGAPSPAIPLEASSTQATSTQPTAAASATATSAPTFGVVEASALAAGLTAGDTAALESVVVLPSDVNLSADVLAALQSMGLVVFDVASFHDNGDGTATVNATAGGTTWVANLLLVDGRWMLAATEQSG